MRPSSHDTPTSTAMWLFLGLIERSSKEQNYKYFLCWDIIPQSVRTGGDRGVFPIPQSVSTGGDRGIFPIPQSVSTGGDRGLLPIPQSVSTGGDGGLLLRRFIRNSLFDKNKKEKKRNPRKIRKELWPHPHSVSGNAPSMNFQNQMESVLI